MDELFKMPSAIRRSELGEHSPALLPSSNDGRSPPTITIKSDAQAATSLASKGKDHSTDAKMSDTTNNAFASASASAAGAKASSGQRAKRDAGARGRRERPKLPPGVQRADFSGIRVALGGGRVRFPWKLHQLLIECKTNGNEGIAEWLPCGTAFRIHDKDEFARSVMPRYFQSDKYKTFQRSLNVWGFEAVTHGRDKGAVYHPLFHKDRPDLCRRMARKGIKDPTCLSALAAAAASTSSSSPTKNEPKTPNAAQPSASALSGPSDHAAMQNIRMLLHEGSVPSSFAGSLACLSQLVVVGGPAPLLAHAGASKRMADESSGNTQSPSSSLSKNGSSNFVTRRDLSHDDGKSELQDPSSQLVARPVEDEQHTVQSVVSSTHSPTSSTPRRISLDQELPLTSLSTSPSPSNFAARLHALLDDPAVSSVAWRPDGRCFGVIDVAEFENGPLRDALGLDSMLAFEEALEKHDVCRIDRGLYAGSYYHDFLVRGLPHLCRHMRTSGMKKVHPADPAEVERAGFLPCESTKPSAMPPLIQERSAPASLRDDRPIASNQALALVLQKLFPEISSNPQPPTLQTSSLAAPTLLLQAMQQQKQPIDLALICSLLAQKPQQQQFANSPSIVSTASAADMDAISVLTMLFQRR